VKIYNSLSKKKEEFKSLNDRLVTIYSCGPTVYNFAHIGNLRTYINSDILRRFLEFSGYTVKQAMNVTDVEDKIIREAKKTHVDIKEITDKYEKYLFEDLKKLNIEKVEYYPHATKEIPAMIKMIEKLLDKGYAYKSDDGSIYFSIEKFKKYGKLSGLDKEGIKVGARVDQDEYEKESAQDFVLWKAKKEDEPSWPAPFGEGRPGWHIECSAMSMRYLGETIDIHTGGVDLLFPHHENEIAQSEAYSGKKFVDYWFHGEFLQVNGQKMSKSLHNIYTLDEIVSKYQVEPLAFRILCLMSHYRDTLNFTDLSIVQAQNTLNNLKDFIIRLKTSEGENKNLPVDTLMIEAEKHFSEALDDDLNTPKAMSVLFDFIKGVNKLFVQGFGEMEAKAVLKFLVHIDSVLGLGFENIEAYKPSDEVKDIFNRYLTEREKKNFDNSDKLRIELNSHGWTAEDSREGSRLVKL
jgi:cysteinyl-tRNA synthetase